MNYDNAWGGVHTNVFLNFIHPRVDCGPDLKWFPINPTMPGINDRSESKTKITLVLNHVNILNSAKSSNSLTLLASILVFRLA